MKLKALAAVILSATLLTACGYESTKTVPTTAAGDPTAVTSDGGASVTAETTSGTASTFQSREGASENYTFDDLVSYMESSDAVKNWLASSKSYDGIEGENWYNVPELQKICSAEIEGESAIKNYTAFHIYYSDKEQILDKVTYFEIYELDKTSPLYNYTAQAGALEYAMKVPYRDYENFDQDEYLANYHNMTTAERMLYSYDASGNPIMMDDTKTVTFPIHGLNGKFIIVVHSGAKAEDGSIFEAFSADNDEAQAIVDAFMNFG